MPKPEREQEPSNAPAVPSDACSLDESAQFRNVLIFSTCTGLQYLAAPVLYVGMTQGALLNRLGASPTIANLPETAFFLLTATPVLLAWLVPGVEHLRKSLALCYLAAAVGLALVAASLIAPVSIEWRIAAVIFQGAASGAAMPTAIALLWEAIGRGVGPQRRGLALGLAFGAGPLLAVIGSLGQQILVTGKLFQLEVGVPEFPWNFAVLFGAGVPVLLLAAGLSRAFVIPKGEPAPPPKLLAGMWEFLSRPVLFWATVVTVLLYVGNTIPTNMNLYTPHVIDSRPEDLAGYQLAVRFSFKVAIGAILGWLLTRSNPRAGILATGAIFVLSQVFAIFATGQMYVLAFGIYGAGELVGVYAPNYILSASPARDFRRNMAYVTMMMLPAAPMGALFGAIATRGANLWGPANAFRASFLVCAVILVIGLALAIITLPPTPKSDPENSGR